MNDLVCNRYVQGLDKGKGLYFLFVKSESKTPGGLSARPVITSYYNSDYFKTRDDDPYNVYTSPNEAILCPDSFQSMYTQMLCGLYERKQVLRLGAVFESGLLPAIRFLQLNWTELAHDIRTGTLDPRVTEPCVRECMTRFLKPDPDLADFISVQCSEENWESIISDHFRVCLEAWNNSSSPQGGSKLEILCALHRKCPLCESRNTKFCNYDQYELRYVCNNCSCNWTDEGMIRASIGESSDSEDPTQLIHPSTANLNIPINGDGGHATNQEASGYFSQLIMGESSNSRDPTQLIPLSTANLYNSNNNPVDRDGGQHSLIAIHQAFIKKNTQEKKIDKDEAINHKMNAGMLKLSMKELRIDIPPDAISAEVSRKSKYTKLIMDNIREPKILDKVRDLVLSTSAQGAVSLMSSGSPAFSWVIVGANGIAFTTSLISMFVRAKKPDASSFLAKVGIGAFVMTVMGVTYINLPVYVKWIAGLGCAIPIAAIIYAQ